MTALASTGTLRIGLMPTFTRAALAPTLKDYVREHPDVKLRIVEGYSSVLTEMVLAEEIAHAHSGGLAMGIAVQTDMAMPPILAPPPPPPANGPGILVQVVPASVDFRMPAP